MSSKRETALQALLSVLEGAHGHVVRNQATTELINKLPSQGIVVLHDGDPGEPEETISPLMYHYEHAAEVDVVCQGTNASSQFDAICRAIGTAIAENRTLNGAVDWAEATAPAPSDIPREGAAPIKGATIVVRLHYATPDPLN